MHVAPNGTCISEASYISKDGDTGIAITGGL
jgi:hypothetical protein